MDDELTLAEAAARLGRNLELVRVWVASGRLPGRKRADRWFIAASDVAEFMEREPIRRTWSNEAKTRAAQAAGRNER
jgi:predicted site-specific integrase-resolvase